jgi:signal peptidase I
MPDQPVSTSTSTTPEPARPHPDHDTNVVETIQSLIVAFVLAMTFRGFVTEGFVIPTGSMAPTLLGQHLLVHSPQTGVDFAVGLDTGASGSSLTDPMLGPHFSQSVPYNGEKRRMGDRILVLKSLYPFAEPKRFDVVVFKNPTDPVGEAANYIKRLIGLPNEQVWLADGDVFSKRNGEREFRVRGKPEHVQRAVWQPVYHSDFIPVAPEKLNRRYDGPPWVGDASWDTSGREYRCTTAQASMLSWDHTRRPITDWTAYNMLNGTRQSPWPISDIRISAAITAEQAGLKTTLEIRARSHLFEFVIDATGTGKSGEAQATMRMRSEDGGDWTVATASIDLPNPGETLNVEFWHVDQSMHMFVNGKPVMEPLKYDWQPLTRLQNATGDVGESDVDSLRSATPLSPQIRWRFEGSPVTLSRIRLDRDLQYRSDRLDPLRQQRNMPKIEGPAFGTDPVENAAILGPDQFMMCGDNSQMSLDSRLWGSPHPLARQIDSSPFLVNRRLLLGKAWVVYFPAPFSITKDGMPVIPDFGRLRFIR